MSRIPCGLSRRFAVTSDKDGQPLTHITTPIWRSPSGQEIVYENTMLPNGFQLYDGESEITVLWSASMCRTDVIIIESAVCAGLELIGRASLPGDDDRINSWVENQINGFFDRLAASLNKEGPIDALVDETI